MRDNPIRAWSQCTIPLRQPTDDNRKESWRINHGENARQAIGAVTVLGRLNKDTEFIYLASRAASSIKDLNSARWSLGVIAPDSIEPEFKRREEADVDQQITLFDHLELNGPPSGSDLIPQLTFKDASGWHTLTLKEWGCAEYLRKHRNQAERLWDALRLGESEYEHLLFIGNLNSLRTTWLIIKVISRKKQQQSELFVWGALGCCVAPIKPRLEVIR